MKLILIGLVILLNLASAGFLLTVRRSTDIILVLFVFLVASVILQAVLTFHMWNVIHDGKSALNPYVAAGLHFIPVLGFLWTLLVFGMYPSAYNDYTERNSNGAGNIDSSPFNTYVLVTLLSIPILFIPIIKLFVPLVMLILYIRVIATACDAVNELKNNAGYSLEIDGPRPASNNPLSLNV